MLGCRNFQIRSAAPREKDHLTRRLLLISLASALTLWLPSDGHAQPRGWGGRGFVNLNGGSQRGTQEISTTWTFSRFGEQGRIDLSHGIDRSGGLFDLSGGVRVWQSLAFGGGFSRVSGTTFALLSATVPHPLFVNRPRSATRTLAEITHTERAVHFQAVWILPVWSRIDLAVSGGPSVVTLEQGFVTDADASEVGPPFSQISVSTTMTEQKKSGPGFTVGVDINYMVTRNVGVGVLGRYLGASIDLPFRSTQTSMNIGGLQVAGGLRVRF